MLKRAPTRIELKPEDRLELDEVQKANRKQGKWSPSKWPSPPAQTPAEQREKSVAQRIGLHKGNGSPAQFR
jgi:hypothetical protein